MGVDVHTARILTVRLGGEVFAIPASIVREILDVGRVTPVPTAPAFVCNLINVRGRVVPLADLRLRFGMPAAEPTMDTRIVVLEVGLDGEPTTVAVLADKVYEVTQLDEVVSTDVPRIGSRWRPEFVAAIGRRNGQFVMVLDVDKVFAADREVYLME
jgi:purine-binding chemotaxis protein CheW